MYLLILRNLSDFVTVSDARTYVEEADNEKLDKSDVSIVSQSSHTLLFSRTL
jgi:hypothetical protein